MLGSGQKIEFHNPTLTHVGASLAFRNGFVVLRSVRYLVRELLTVEEFYRRPYVRRSRWLFLRARAMVTTDFTSEILPSPAHRVKFPAVSSRPPH
jgi:hypothetical protein